MKILAAYAALGKRQQLMILIGAPALVVCLLGYLVYQSLGVLGPDERIPGFLQRHAPDNLWDDINGKVAQIEEQRKEASKLEAVKKLIADLKNDFNSARERLPKESEKTVMRSLIEKLARDIPSDIGTVQVDGVHIIEEPIDSSRSGVGDTPPKVTYHTDITGDINGIIKYIDVIEKNPRFMVVDSITIKPGGVTMDAEHKMILAPHSVHLSLSTFFLPDAVPGAGR